MPAKPDTGVGAGRQRKHVSIFDRSGQTPNRNRAQTGKGTGNNTSFNQGPGHRNAQGGHGDDSGVQGAPIFFNKVCMLRVHEDVFSSSDLVVNASFFPGIRVGDIVSIRPLADGDEGDLVSPRGSADNSDAATTASMLAASGTDGNAGAPSGGASTTKTSNTAGHASTANSVWAADSATAGEGGGSSVRGGGSTGPDPKNAGAVRGSSRKEYEEKHRMCSGGGGSSGNINGSVPKQPNRWMGGSEHEHERTLFTGASERTDDDNTDVPFRPTPHCEIVLQVGEVRRDAQQLQASVLTSVARTLWGDYQTNQRVAIRKINIDDTAEREAIRADFVEIAFRDQYVGRSDMWRLWRVLAQRVVHANKPTNIDGLIRASVRRIYKNNVQVACGFIDASTQAIFRSESGRFIIFVQMCEEMWEYQEDGNLCFEKAVNCFLAELFRRWSDKQLNHMVTIVMFSRWYYHVRDSLYFQDLVYDDATGRYYRDYYKVIADMEVRADWTVVLPEILSEFNSYRRDIQELVSSAGHRLRGDLSRAGQGNVLEAINLGINSFASNHVDRDLARTGLSTVVITPSFGVFDVDKDLLRMTTERMLHFGLRVDLVCLAPKPLFRPPVFRFRSHPVPSEQEQRRALQNRRAAKEDAEKAKAAGMNSLSPRAESPGAHIASGGSGSANNGGGGQSTTLSKDRGAKAMANVKPENVVAVDPIMLDPLYFDGDRWESELLPFLLGTHVRGGAWQSGGSSESRNSSERLAQTRAGGSAINALLSSMDSAVDDIPDTIKELTLDDYPFFAGRRAADRRVTYCYFPYWVDCGFYDYTDERGAERPDAFRPACQMGSLAGDGASTYLRTAPVIPDVQLRAMDAELAALLGLPAAGNTAEAQPADEHMALRELFDRFDRRAIVGTGVSVLAHPADGVAGGPTDAVDVLLTAPHTGMRSMTSSANDTRLASHASHVSVGPGTAAYWDEHGMRPRGDLGLPTVSTSASPNLPHAGRSASARPTKQAAVSSSVPRETSINVAAAAAAAGRASVFGAQRRKPQASRSGSAESAESGELPVSMAAVAAGSAKWRGASPQSGGRVAGPAGHMRLPSDAVPVAVAMAMAVPPPPAAERSAVSESIAKQSHMDDHVRTFRGGQDMFGQPQQQQQQQPSQQQLLHQPPSQSPSQPLSQPLSHHSSGHPAFQLTLPAGRAIPPAPPVSTAPGDARHASPQPARTVWLSERHALGTHVAEQVRGRGPPAYNPCNPSLAPLPHTELSQRWAMAFPTYWLLSSFSPKWRSLCTPASLPLVTDYQPANLDSFYSRFSYFVQTPGLAATALPAGHDDEEFAQFVAARTPASALLAAAPLRHVDRATLVMLREMVYQRLAQGFQFVTHSARDSVRQGARGALAAVAPALAPAVWLSNGRQIQQLEIQAGGEAGHVPGVGVTRWERSRVFRQDAEAYRLQMWPRNSSTGYRSQTQRFEYPRSEEVNWNNLDFLIFGHQTKLARSMKYWRARYVLIPVDQLAGDTIVSAKSSPQMSVEDVRIANFERFLDHILRLLSHDDRARLEARFLAALPPAMQRDTSGGRPGASASAAADAGKTVALASLTPSALMQIRFTTLYPAPYAANQLAAYMHDAIYLDPARPIALPPPASQLGLGDSLSPESPFAQLAHALQHSRGGIGLRNVRWHDERLSAVFAGYQLVDWMLVNFASVGSRAQALAAGARLVDRGLVVSAQGRPGFMDGHHFYAFTDAAVACRAAPRHGRSTASPAPSRPASRQGPDSALQAAGKLHVRTDASAAGDASGADAAAPGDAAVHASTAPSPLPSPGAECVRTPDVFPRLAARRSRRALPKTLAQSRTFTLDLDQQRRSPRTEHCVVHLDAVQNPTTCFHLSINWLSCTNALVDELVRGWGRMAERCGMRLVEAPRAHDAEDTHPFHSPIPIALALPPPPAERIFDAEWASAFGFFGDTDSEPESSSDDSASEHALDWVYAAERTARRRRTRTLKRMRRCIPTFPFERELLDEQDFVLDVEAEDCFPDARLLHREYTFERQGYAHTQYVHRSGAAFVQICGPGQFLWINNHLYTAHQAHHRPQHPPLASAPSQMSLGAYGATAAPDTSAASTPLSSARPPPAKPSTAASAAAAAAAPDACPPSPASAASAARMVPAFYPMRRTREMWPHQIHRSLAMHKLPHRTLEIPEWYSLQVVDRLGTQPADFDSVNAAITRVAVMRQAEGPSPLGSSAQTGDTSATDACFWSPGAREPPGVEHVASPAFNEARGQWAAEQPPASAAPQPMPTETNPDVLRANFIEVCRDQNSLEMLWQQTIGRYRNAWRAHCAGTVPDGESPKSKPMVVDMFSEGMWQARKPSH